MKSIRYSLLVIVFALFSASIQAQHINTMYFLENAPLRHTINPAFQHVSRTYVVLPVIGNTSLLVGNNGISMQDLIFTNEAGETITALHPSTEGQLWHKLPELLSIDADINFGLVGFGRRIKEKGYLTINASAHIITGIGLPKKLFSPLLGQSIENLDLKALNVSASAYTDISFGYSHKINDQWAVGGKLKLLMGVAYASGQFEEFTFKSNADLATLKGKGSLRLAMPLDINSLMGEENNDIPSEESDDIYPEDNNDYIEDNTDSESIGTQEAITEILSYVKPQGYGGAIDLGFTYKPVSQLQIAVSVTDLGLIHWRGGSTGEVYVDTTFTGVGHFNYSDYVVDGKFQSDLLTSEIQANLEKYGSAIHINDFAKESFNQMLTANLNVGLDANFWKNRIGIGVYSHTRFFNILDNFFATEEVTIGAAFRPANWFNLAVSYSFLNSHWSNAGAAISLAPYDGLMLTVAADYIPLTFADYPTDNGAVIPLPYKTSQVNLSFGLAIVIGTNPKRNRDLQE